MSSALVYSYTPLNSQKAKIIDLQVLENRQEVRTLVFIILASGIIWIIRYDSVRGNKDNYLSQSQTQTQIERVSHNDYHNRGLNVQTGNVKKVTFVENKISSKNLMNRFRGGQVTENTDPN